MYKRNRYFHSSNIYLLLDRIPFHTCQNTNGKLALVYWLAWHRIVSGPLSKEMLSKEMMAVVIDAEVRHKVERGMLYVCNPTWRWLYFAQNYTFFSHAQLRRTDLSCVFIYGRMCSTCTHLCGIPHLNKIKNCIWLFLLNFQENVSIIPEKLLANPCRFDVMKFFETVSRPVGEQVILAFN